MDAIRNWVMSIAATTMIMSLVSVITPKNSQGKTVMLFGTMILTAVFIAPVRGFEIDKIEKLTAQYERDFDEFNLQFAEENEKLNKSIIEKNLKAYILKRAAEEKLEFDVRVIYGNDSSYKIEIYNYNEDDVDEISEIIEKECGVSPDMQTLNLEV